MTKVTIATFNTWNCQGQFVRRLPLMIAGLQALGADIILLQEVFAQAPAGLHVGQRLADGLRMDLSFAPARTKIRKINGAPLWCHSGLAVLSKTPIQSSRVLHLPMDECDGERIGQVVQIDLKGLRLDIANIHLTHLKNADELRHQQLQMLVNNLNGKADLTVIGGDMNMPRGHTIFQQLAEYTEPVIDHPVPPSSINPVSGNVPCCSMGIIDHVFLRQGPGRSASAKAHLTMNAPAPKSGIFPSDHMAVVVDVTVS